MDHLGASLSAYLDGALDPAARAEVDAHLATCATCRTRLEQLRATARLIAALPAARPSRSLVPPVAAAPRWARPVRSLASIASGVFVIAFIASAALSTGFGGGGRGSILGPAGAPAQRFEVFSNISNSLTAPQASAVASAAARAAGGQPTAVPAPAFQFSTASVPPKAIDDASASAAAQRGVAGPQGTAAPAAPVAPSASGAPERIIFFTTGYGPPQLAASPWLWLALALLSGAVAVFAHRRARAR